jgi:glycosyltransferase involved in cell wall biosynthesis
VTRTLHLINSLGTGGAERSLAELLGDLPAFGIDPSVVIFERRTDGVEEQVRAQDIDVHVVDQESWVGRGQAVRSLIRQVRPDVLHTSLFEADVVGRVASAGTSTKVLTSLVNTSYDRVRYADPAVHRGRLLAAQAIDAATGRVWADHFHAISRAVEHAAIRSLRIPAERITVVPRGRRRNRLGERSEERRREVRIRLGIPNDAFLILHVGREEYQKAHAILLEAVVQVLPRRPEVHLVLAGRPGNASAIVESLLPRLPGDRIHRLGHVERVPDLLASADLFVFPSLYEGLGGAAVEAMAMEVPMVVSDIPALRELLEGVATFVPPNDAVALSRAIDDVVNRGADIAAARRGRRVFDENYEHDVVVAEMARVFHRTCEL